jgi:hypothetical protein
MNVLLGLEFVFIIGAAVIAIYAGTKNPPILWVSVILLCVAEAVGHAGGLAH